MVVSKKKFLKKMRDTYIDTPTDYTKLSTQQRGRVRNQYVQEQKGKCMHCKCSLNKGPPDFITDKKINWDLFPEHFLRHPVHLQHCHKTGMTEGAVHAYCNAVMWQYHGR